MKFCVVDFSVDNAPWWDKPVEVDGDETETLIETISVTMRETVDILKISAASIGSHLCQLGYANCFDVCIPQKLSEKNLLDCIPANDSLLLLLLLSRFSRVRLRATP